jgi:hypothetical protein
MRNVVLAGALLIIGLLGFLTLSVAAQRGVDVLVVVSLIVLVIIGVGVIGALTTPPDE